MHSIHSYQHTRIKKLSPLLINQLSAGEVVTRPASVVKELLENAIDAGATKIKISITQGGMGLIEITDNGNGIHPDDMLMAVTRHATSKVADVEHLQGINTLGFRGEALASISAVSRLTLISSHDSSGVGRSLSVAGKIENPNITPVVCQQGTTVSVKDLYFNVPARRGNLKSVQTEYAHIEAMIRHVALVYPEIELSLYHENKSRLQLSVTGKVSHQANHHHLTQQFDDLMRFQQAWGNALPEQAYPLEIDLSGLQAQQIQSGQKAFKNAELQSSAIQAKVTGWLWIADGQEQRGQGSKITLPKLIYVNARLVKDTAISQQIRQSIQSIQSNESMMSEEILNYGYALFFTLPTEWLNLNVHPSKQRISIHTLANINAHLHYGIQQLVDSVIKQQQSQQTKNSQRYNQQYSQKNSQINWQTTTNDLKQNDVEADTEVDIRANIEADLEANIEADKDRFGFQYSTHQQQKKWQVASPKATYQVAELTSDEPNDAEKGVKVSIENHTEDEIEDSHYFLNDLEKFLSILTEKPDNPVIRQLFSQEKNHWFNVQAQILDKAFLKKFDCSDDISIMWTDLPNSYVHADVINSELESELKLESETNRNHADRMLIVALNHRTLASHSVVYPMNILKAKL